MNRARELLAPWQPSVREPFDLARAGHLLRRGAFGGSLALRRSLVARGVDAALDELFDPSSDPQLDAGFTDVVAFDDIERVRAYWVWRMVQGPPRIRARMTLFWHDHFATSNVKVRSARLMARQLQLFERAGLGKFDALLLEVSRDPAMVRWLDSESNVRGRANENYARELFELFTLGVGQYSEQDVKEAARAFTGWHLRGESFAFRQRFHDGAAKRVLGRRGALGGEDVVALAAAHPASARFVARKLLAFFVHPRPTTAEVDALAAAYRDAGRDLGATLRVLLRSRLFFSPRAWRSRIKSPVDFVVGMVRCLGGRAAPLRLTRAIADMGQVLLEPPNVAGWPGERAWMTSATWLARTNFAGRLFTAAYKTHPAAATVLERPRPAQRADLAIELLLDGVIDDTARQAIHRLAETGVPPADLLHAVQCLPEGHLL
ncbi:MAG: DUF1800 domain-containing protein [Planctomycetes bacterium]|nr:DUF1800 domain-containing protein [Planctomycetota bacterium]MCB9869941.1 DUF1800 domain-containing protein [Planctomycetota bacterium]